MNWLEIGLTVLSTGLGIANAVIAKKKGMTDQVLDAVIDGVENVNDKITKKSIQKIAENRGVEPILRKRIKRRL